MRLRNGRSNNYTLRNFFPGLMFARVAAELHNKISKMQIFFGVHVCPTCRRPTQSCGGSLQIVKIVKIFACGALAKLATSIYYVKVAVQRRIFIFVFYKTLWIAMRIENGKWKSNGNLFFARAYARTITHTNKHKQLAIVFWEGGMLSSCNNSETNSFKFVFVCIVN